MSEQVLESEKEVVAREFRFAYHIPTKSKEEPDYHFVKEQVHYKINGEIVIKPELRLIKDFHRPVFFTSPHLRTHKEKREFEKLENLMRVDVRQSELKETVARMTNNFNYHASLRELCGSPFVYGADIPSTLLLRKVYYTDKYPNVVTPRTVCTFDTETDVVDGIGDIIITSACFQNEVYVGIQKRKVQGWADAPEKISNAINKHLKQFIDERNLKVTFYIADDEIDLLRDTFKKIHSWRPDFLAIWNMNFDIPKIIIACDRANVNPAEIFCDPNLPRQFWKFKYKEGATKKVTAAGKEFPIKPANQWHTLECTASFYVIDAMCCYRRIRGGAELPSYSLDAILTKELNLTKLRIPEAEKFKKLEWHRFMQRNMIFDYIAYGLFDSYSMLLLDEKTKDLSRTLAYLADFTNFEDYASQTKRLRDNFYLFGLESLGIVIGSLGPKKKDKKPKAELAYDNEIIDYSAGDDGEDSGLIEDVTLDRRNWVVTLRAFMSVLGQNLIMEDSSLQTLIRAFVYDSDVVSSYPNCTLVANVSKRTTRKEIISIGDIPERVFRMQNLNFIFGLTNASEYTQTMFGFPTFSELNQQFKLHKATVNI